MLSNYELVRLTNPSKAATLHCGSGCIYKRLPITTAVGRKVVT